MQLHTYSDSTALSRAFVDWLIEYVHDVVQKQGRFTVALSGGSTPQQVFELLATDEYRDQMPWAQWHVFWGDERDVPFEDERNNARMAYKTLLDHVPVPADQIHVMQTDSTLDNAVADYEAVLHTYFDNQATTFDLVMLGMGDDGHTLSLFPGTAVIHETGQWTKAYFLPAQDMYRITLTTPVVNKAACIAFLVTGPKKATALHEVLEGAYQPDTYPSQVIKPENGNLHWFIDEEAASQLQQLNA